MSRISKSITFSPTPEGFAKLEQFLNDYAKFLKESADKLLDAMLSIGEQWMIMDIQHIDTGETLSTIAAYRDGNKGYLIVGGAAVWIEFGTGVARNQDNEPHPKAEALGMSPWGTYGKGYGSNPNGWWYKGADGKGHHTRGIRGNKFVYNAAQYIKESCPQMAKEIWK